MTSLSFHPLRYLIWVGVPAWAIAVLSGAYWMRFGAPIWSAF